MYVQVTYTHKKHNKKLIYFKMIDGWSMLMYVGFCAFIIVATYYPDRIQYSRPISNALRYEYVTTQRYVYDWRRNEGRYETETTYERVPPWKQ
jgi:hypothetical protein